VRGIFAGEACSTVGLQEEGPGRPRNIPPILTFPLAGGKGHEVKFHKSGPTGWSQRSQGETSAPGLVYGRPNVVALIRRKGQSTEIGSLPVYGRPSVAAPGGCPHWGTH